jgi:hypothetical protein
MGPVSTVLVGSSENLLVPLSHEDDNQCDNNGDTGYDTNHDTGDGAAG